ncbi:MAG: stage III sporulation protein AF [Clostridiales bacterium]|nr:stage III sporulation protein AF [Clostridiales bacterium]
MEFVYEWVRNIVIYLILNTVIMNLLGSSSYKKYVSIVSGMILLLIVLSPFLKLLRMDGIMDYYLNSNIYNSEARDFKRELKLMEDKQRDEVFTDYKEKIKEQVEELISKDGLYIYDFDLVMNMDEDSEDFGHIKDIKIEAGYEKYESAPVQKISIDRIVISEKALQKIDSPEEIQIKNKLSDFYNMEQDNININIQR